MVRGGNQHNVEVFIRKHFAIIGVSSWHACLTSGGGNQRRFRATACPHRIERPPPRARLESDGTDRLPYHPTDQSDPFRGPSMTADRASSLRVKQRSGCLVLMKCLRFMVFKGDSMQAGSRTSACLGDLCGGYEPSWAFVHDRIHRGRFANATSPVALEG